MSHKTKVLIPISYAFVSFGYFYLVGRSQELNNSQVFGIVVAGLSFFLWVIARIQLGRAFSLMPKAKMLVTTGLYSKIRNPVYVFSCTALLGIILFMQSWPLTPALLSLIVIEIFRARREEKILAEKFGVEYIEYKRKTWL